MSESASRTRPTPQTMVGEIRGITDSGKIGELLVRYVAGTGNTHNGNAPQALRRACMDIVIIARDEGKNLQLPFTKWQDALNDILTDLMADERSRTVALLRREEARTS